MPIRFRCAYCNQLMGIARRKVGTVVRCPKCAGEVIVPTPPDMETGTAGVGASNDQVSSLLEDGDFDADFGPAPTARTPLPADGSATATTSPPSAQAEPLTGIDVQDLGEAGVFIPRRMLAAAIVLAVLALGATFLAGFVVGRAVGLSVSTVAAEAP